MHNRPKRTKNNYVQIAKTKRKRHCFILYALRCSRNDLLTSVSKKNSGVLPFSEPIFFVFAIFVSTSLEHKEYYNV